MSSSLLLAAIMGRRTTLHLARRSLLIGNDMFATGKWRFRLAATKFSASTLLRLNSSSAVLGPALTNEPKENVHDQERRDLLSHRQRCFGGKHEEAGGKRARVLAIQARRRGHRRILRCRRVGQHGKPSRIAPARRALRVEPGHRGAGGERRPAGPLDRHHARHHRSSRQGRRQGSDREVKRERPIESHRRTAPGLFNSKIERVDVWAVPSTPLSPARFRGTEPAMSVARRSKFPCCLVWPDGIFTGSPPPVKSRSGSATQTHPAPQSGSARKEFPDVRHGSPRSP